MPGGKRAGAGRTTKFAAAAKSESAAAAMQKLFEAVSEEDQREVVNAVIAAAKGIRVLVKIEKKGARRVIHEHEEEFQTSYGEPCWIWSKPPDVAAQKLVLEHLKGRPATQSKVETDTTINLVLPAGVRKGR